VSNFRDTASSAVPQAADIAFSVSVGSQPATPNNLLARISARLSNKLSLRAGGVAWNSAGSIGYLFLHAIGITLIARAAGVEAIGIYLLAQAIGMPLSMFCGLRYHDINATEQSLSKLSGHFRNIALVALPSTALALALWCLFTEGDSRLVGVNIILANVLQGFAQAPQGRMIRLRKFRHAALFEISRGIFSVLSFGFGLLVLDSLLQATVLLLLSWMFLLAIEYRVASAASSPAALRDTGKGTIFEQMRYAVGDSLGLFQTSSVRIVVGVMMTEAAVGILGATALLIKFLHPLAIGLAKTVLPDVAEELAREDFRRIGQRLKIINVATGGCIAVFAAMGYWLTPGLIELLLGPELRPPAWVAAILMIGAAPLIGSRFLTHLLIALRQRKSVERAALSGLICSVVLAVPLIWAFGLAGAAGALAVSYCFRYSLEVFYILRSARTKTISRSFGFRPSISNCESSVAAAKIRIMVSSVTRRKVDRRLIRIAHQVRRKKATVWPSLPADT